MAPITMIRAVEISMMMAVFRMECIRSPPLSARVKLSSVGAAGGSQPLLG